MSKTYNVGYYNKPWSKSDFVILAQTKSFGVANFIETSYNEGYERNGLSVRAEIIENDNLPEDYRFSADHVFDC